HPHRDDRRRQPDHPRLQGVRLHRGADAGGGQGHRQGRAIGAHRHGQGPGDASPGALQRGLPEDHQHQGPARADPAEPVPAGTRRRPGGVALPLARHAPGDHTSGPEGVLMQVAVVANPTSGRGKGARIIPKVEELLSSAGVSHTMLLSRNGADPERLAREAASDGATVVAALGGDGHVGNVANGLIASPAALAVIPAGTGNDFARVIGLDRKDPVAAARLLLSDTPATKRIDVVRVRHSEGERYYVNVAGTGFDSAVNEHANQVTVLKGTLKYIYSTF